jgi:hypothetical protein
MTHRKPPRYERSLTFQIPKDSIGRPPDPPKKTGMKFLLFLLWNKLIHGGNR